MFNFIQAHWALAQQAMDLFVLGCGLFGLSVLIEVIRNSYVRSR